MSSGLHGPRSWCLVCLCGLIRTCGDRVLYHFGLCGCFDRSRHRVSRVVCLCGGFNRTRYRRLWSGSVEVGGLGVGGLEAIVRVSRFFARKPAITRWHVVLAFVPFCCIAPFVWPHGSCGPDLGMPLPRPCLNRVTP